MVRLGLGWVTDRISVNVVIALGLWLVCLRVAFVLGLGFGLVLC